LVDDLYSIGPSLAARKMREILVSQATFAIILQDPMRLPAGVFRVKIAALGSLKNVTESIFKVSELNSSNLKLLFLFF
jgi:hypothetical protein